MYIILPFVLPFTSQLIRKERFQPKNLSLIGVTILFLVLFMHVLLSTGQDNYVTVARTDDIEQVHKIQTIFSDEYIPVRITKDGSKYGIELKYDKRILEYAPILLVENGLEAKNVDLKIGVDYGDLDTLEERLEKKLEKIIPHITGVYSADVDLTISFAPMDKCCEPIIAKVSIVTDEGSIPERIEDNVAKLLLLTVHGLTDDNIHINNFINK
ncbi:MAG: hypothetical protein NC408_09710 [Candidatus Gastranaerophilales bacterium]|nr:hypothetical protein [Candidatus Gastranaerophilales bacterium]MCM1073057.1 hypothetical protein [Bacteroides sp.]